MDCIVDQSNLARALRLVSRAVPTRSTLPVLQTVRLEARDNRLNLATTDLEVGITTSVIAQVATSGTICVPARLLGDYVSQLPNQPTRLTVNPEGHRVRLSCGRFGANLATLDAAEFPALPQPEEARALTFDAKRLREAIARVAFAAARDDSRPILTAVLFDFGPDGLTLAAADGFRLARARLTEVNASPLQLLVPAKAVSELGRLLGEAESVRLVPTEGSRGVCFASGETTLFTRLIDGRFPDVDRVIPRETTSIVIVETASFQQAIRGAALFGGSADARPVVIEAAQGCLHVRARGDDTGDAEADLPAELEGELSPIALNTRLLVDALDAVDAARIRLSWSSSHTPIVLREEGRGETADVIILMPLADPALTRPAVAA